MQTNSILGISSIGVKAILIIVNLFFIFATMINLLPFLDKDNSLMDFGSFYASALKIQHGENPYDPNSEYIFEIHFRRVGAGGIMMNLNPPISVLIFQVLPQFDPHRALIVWQAASAILYAGVALLLAGVYKQNITPTIFIWAFTLAGFWHTLVLGQVYIVLLLFSVLGWVFIQRGRYVLAGVAIGVVIALKPNFFVWAIFLLVSGYYAVFITSALSSLAISLIPVIFYGPGIYAQWLEASALRYETLIMPGNNSIAGLTARFNGMSVGILASVIVVILLIALSRFRSSTNLEKVEYVSALGIIASLLASPISWTGYTILVLPVFFSLKKWTLPTTISAAILSIPFPIVLQLFQRSFVNFVIFGWLYGWGILLLLVAVVKNIMMTKSIQTN